MSWTLQIYGLNFYLNSHILFANKFSFLPDSSRKNTKQLLFQRCNAYFYFNWKNNLERLRYYFIPWISVFPFFYFIKIFNIGFSLTCFSSKPRSSLLKTVHQVLVSLVHEFYWNTTAEDVKHLHMAWLDSVSTELFQEGECCQGLGLVEEERQVQPWLPVFSFYKSS